METNKTFEWNEEAKEEEWKKKNCDKTNQMELAAMVYSILT